MIVVEMVYDVGVIIAEKIEDMFRFLIVIIIVIIINIIIIIIISITLSRIP